METIFPCFLPEVVLKTLTVSSSILLYIVSEPRNSFNQRYLVYCLLPCCSSQPHLPFCLLLLLWRRFSQRKVAVKGGAVPLSMAPSGLRRPAPCLEGNALLATSISPGPFVRVVVRNTDTFTALQKTAVQRERSTKEELLAGPWAFTLGRDHFVPATNSPTFCIS